MGKERRRVHDCSDGFEKTRRSPGARKATKGGWRLFPPGFLSRFFKIMDGSCDECAGGRVGPFTYFLLHSLTQFEIVKQKEMKWLSPLAKPFKNNIRKARDYDTIKMIEMDS